MTKLGLAGLLFAGLMTAACATTDAEKASMQAVADGSDPVICRKVHQTGTRFGTRVCKSESTWAQIDQQAAEGANEMQSAVARGANTTFIPGSGMGGGSGN